MSLVCFCLLLAWVALMEDLENIERSQSWRKQVILSNQDLKYYSKLSYVEIIRIDSLHFIQNISKLEGSWFNSSF